jgi:hypothetical protein
MSLKQMNLSPDLQRLVDENYALECRDGYLMIHNVPYVDDNCMVQRALLVTDIGAGGRISNHQMWFTGGTPCDRHGAPLKGINNRPGEQELCEGVVATRRFSTKPPTGQYDDHYDKVTTYVNILSGPAQAIDPSASACSSGDVQIGEEDSVFFYPDTAASREGIVAVNALLRKERIAIVGLGGTGSYVLDLIAKTQAQEVHLFDGDVMDGHNAYRSPGAASSEDVASGMPKVEYYATRYGMMRAGIIPHAYYLDEKNISVLDGFDFVFLCVDKASARKLVSSYLCKHSIPFIDVGMGMQFVEGEGCLIGTCRVTTCTDEQSEHFTQHADIGGDGDDLYNSNIQVADMNCLNAALAVIKWKKLCGFYQDCYGEHHSVYALNAHQLSSAELVRGVPE